MSKVLLTIVIVTLAILVGCGEEQGFPNPLQIKILTTDEEEEETEETEELSPVGSVTGRILFADSSGEIRAHALSSNEYVTLEGTTKRVSGKDLAVFVNFPGGNGAYLMEDGYFWITNVEPGTHELVLTDTDDVLVSSETAEDSYAEVDVPTSQWIVTVDPERNTTTGTLEILIPGLADVEWQSGEAGQEVVIPKEPKPPEPPEPPKPPTVPTKPIVSVEPLVNPKSVVNGHVYLLDDVNGDVPDDSANNLSGTVVGDPQVVAGLNGNALLFDGVDDGIHIPDSEFINVEGVPFPNRTVMAIFSCADVNRQEKQTIFEEGGLTRGLVIYVFDGEVYVGGWNRAEYNWDGAWLSAPIRSNMWYSVALVIRDAGEAVNDGKFEMWLNGQLIDKEPGGQLYNHANDNAIGYTKENVVFHDGDGAGDGWYFEGLIDEVWVLNQALTVGELGAARVSVEPAGRLSAVWGGIKAQQ